MFEEKDLITKIFFSSPLLYFFLPSPSLFSLSFSSPFPLIPSSLFIRFPSRKSVHFQTPDSPTPTGHIPGPDKSVAPQHCRAQIIKLPFLVADHCSPLTPRLPKHTHKQTWATHNGHITADRSATSAAEGQLATAIRKTSDGRTLHMSGRQRWNKG